MSYQSALSVSRLNDYRSCPLKFRYRVIDRISEPPSPAATRGTLVHSVLEHLYDLPPLDRTVANAHDMLTGRWDDLVSHDPSLETIFAETDQDRWFDSARSLLATYFQREDPTRLNPLPRNRERMITVELDAGVRFRGVIDRLDVAPSGDMRVVDYKTGKMPGPAYQHEPLFQMRVYGLLLTKAEGRPPVQSQLIYLGSNDTMTYWTSADDESATNTQIEALWSAIQESMASGFTPKKGPLCRWCSFQEICPAFGGTPPEISEQGLARLRQVALD